MSNVMILGGHGKVALLAAPKLAGAGHRVTSVFRNPEHTDEVTATGATPVVADLEQLDTERLVLMFSGQDVLVWSAGAGGGNQQRTYAVDRDAAVRAIDAAQQAGVSRFVMVSYLGAGLDHGVPEDDSFYAYAQSKAVADAHLRDSGLQWTILMPGSLTLEPSRGTLHPIASGESVDGDAATSRELVADVIAAVVDAPADQVAGRDLPFHDGDTPIAQALAGR